MHWSLEQARIDLRVEFLRTNVVMTAVFRRMAVVRLSNIAFRNHGQGQAARQQRREHYPALNMFVSGNAALSMAPIMQWQELRCLNAAVAVVLRKNAEMS